MKKLMGILLAASMVFSLAACGSTADTAASSAAGTTATAEGSSNNQAPDVKVGAIILGDETEGYSAAHINGIKEAAAELGMSDDQIVWKYKIAEGGVTADAAEDLVGQGCNLIISNSYGHQTYMEEEAEKYPDINFVAMTGDFAAISDLDNFYNAFTAVYQSRYVSGVVAGMKVKDLVESGTLTPRPSPTASPLTARSRSATSAPTTTPRSSPATPPSSWASRAFTPMSRWRSCTRTPGSTSTRRALPPRP